MSYDSRLSSLIDSTSILTRLPEEKRHVLQTGIHNNSLAAAIQLLQLLISDVAFWNQMEPSIRASLHNGKLHNEETSSNYALYEELEQELNAWHPKHHFHINQNGKLWSLLFSRTFPHLVTNIDAASVTDVTGVTNTVTSLSDYDSTTLLDSLVQLEYTWNAPVHFASLPVNKTHGSITKTRTNILKVQNVEQQPLSAASAILKGQTSHRDTQQSDTSEIVSTTTTNSASENSEGNKDLIHLKLQIDPTYFQLVQRALKIDLQIRLSQTDPIRGCLFLSKLLTNSMRQWLVQQAPQVFQLKNDGHFVDSTWKTFSLLWLPGLLKQGATVHDLFELGKRNSIKPVLLGFVAIQIKTKHIRFFFMTSEERARIMPSRTLDIREATNATTTQATLESLSLEHTEEFHRRPEVARERLAREWDLEVNESLRVHSTKSTSRHDEQQFNIKPVWTIEQLVGLTNASSSSSSLSHNRTLQNLASVVAHLVEQQRDDFTVVRYSVPALLHPGCTIFRETQYLVSYDILQTSDQVKPESLISFDSENDVAIYQLDGRM